MGELYFTRKAIHDLSEIWKFTVDTWSETQADKYYHLIIDACYSLSKKSKKTKSYFEIYPGLHGKKISKHIIFYRIIDPSTIEITRILHEEMDLKSKLKK